MSRLSNRVPETAYFRGGRLAYRINIEELIILKAGDKKVSKMGGILDLLQMEKRVKNPEVKSPFYFCNYNLV
ncbi:MAG: hypothetical protein Ct9H300mP27_01330 [Chloroflexota bacterium]|nr:MAG: hypothetical protein Ct9H300mP27_01330 [Chloroflexota bacterium]